jgi:hypothetical protein
MPPIATTANAGLSDYLGIDNVMGVSWALYAFGGLALQPGQPERALRLLGASDRLRGGTEMPAFVTALTGDLGQQASERLDDSIAAEVYRQGHEMSMEETVGHVRAQRRDDIVDAEQ